MSQLKGFRLCNILIISEGLLHCFQWSFTRDASELDCQENCQSEAYQHNKHEIQTQAYKLLETLQVSNQYIFKSGKDKIIIQHRYMYNK